VVYSVRPAHGSARKHTRTHTCMHTSAHARTHTRSHAHARARKHARAHTHTHTHTHWHTQTNMHTQHKHTHKHVKHTHTHAHAHAHLHTLAACTPHDSLTCSSSTRMHQSQGRQRTEHTHECRAPRTTRFTSERKNENVNAKCVSCRPAVAAPRIAPVRVVSSEKA